MSSGSIVFQQVSVRTELDGLGNVLALVGNRQHDDHDVPPFLLDPAQDLDAGDRLHVEVKKDQVRIQLAGLRDAGGAVVRFADHLEPRVHLEQLAGALAEQGVVVNDQYAHVSAPWHGA